MTDPIAEAAVQAAERGATRTAEQSARDGLPHRPLPKTFHVGPDADVRFPEASNGHPFDGMTVTAWVDNIDQADVAAGRSE